jgi:hypothetical protein
VGRKVSGFPTSTSCSFWRQRKTAEVETIRKAGVADIVVVRPPIDSRDMLDLIRAGASDYLVESEQFEADLAKWRTRIDTRFRRHTNRVISVVSTSGGMNRCCPNDHECSANGTFISETNSKEPP